MPFCILNDWSRIEDVIFGGGGRRRGLFCASRRLGQVRSWKTRREGVGSSSLLALSLYYRRNRRRERVSLHVLLGYPILDT